MRRGALAAVAAPDRKPFDMEREIDTTRDGTVIWQVDLRQPDGTVVDLAVDAYFGDVVRRSADD